MADEKVKGIVVKLIDYKDADKLASIFTLEKGLISAKFTGVRRDKAKMKGVAQPFTFAEFSLVNKSNMRSVISADIIDNFPHITLDYNKTICGYILLDMVRSLMMQDKKEEKLFLLSLSALKDIEEKNEYISLISFILKFLNFSGMELILPESNYIYFDSFTGEFLTTRTNTSSEIDKKVYASLRSIASGEECEVSSNIFKQILRLLHNVIYIRYGEDIKSFQFL